MQKLNIGWYILLYHDVSWEESPFVRHIGGTCAPDVFRDHVRSCKNLGQIVSVEDGFASLQSKQIDAPLFSFWFDDGFRGVRKYAAPILDSYGVTGAISICSRFIDRIELFWRLKLSYLHSIDASRLLRSRIRKLGYAVDKPLRELTLDRFGGDLLAVIDLTFHEAVPAPIQKDAFRLFETPEGVLDLYNHGWAIANHSAAHYPVGEAHVMDVMLEQFEECETYIRNLTSRDSTYWVFPFDRHVTTEAVNKIRRHHKDKVVVLVKNHANIISDEPRLQTLYRVGAPINNRSRMADVLIAASHRRFDRAAHPET